MGLNRSVPHKLYICALNNHLQMLMCRYETNRPLTHRRRSGWNSWGRMASAEGGSVPSGMGYEDACSSPADEGVSGERRDLPSVVRSRAPAGNGFLRILKATECSFLPRCMECRRCLAMRKLSVRLFVRQTREL